ncbi:DHA2 family efflux MFS transporter permease subunit [Sansalvadorimonas verongulae]|uniref:DHA2 family efflux MFS transporter permease subunit n=1 Tax=Sansalvadorimonas verongulae TaxID=2172824 RepID=UPI0012BBF189|nr:DHA2 family efflux MFS transporter permease subunit [Sansalvadorimonas verongulae]MTI13577.1 DHA2 family efflux MFS transporter permease subunit [Sansalvadorimonas verongulae]
MSTAVATSAVVTPTKSTPSAPPQGGVQTASRKDWITVIGMVLGAFVAVLDIQIVNSSLADIQGSLAATVSEGSWITTAYMIAEIVIIPLSGWLASVFSLRRYLLWSVVAFMVMSGLCGTATSLGSMIFYRALQGLAVAPLIPLTFSQIRLRLPTDKQPVGMAMFSFSAVFAPSIGPTIGGWLTENFSWHLIFYINLVPGLLILALLSYGLEKGPSHFERLKTADWSGIISLSLGLSTLEYVLEEGNRQNWFESHSILTIAIVSTLSLITFVYVQLTKANPLLNLRILGDRQFLFGNLANCAMGLALFGSVFLIPVYLSQLQGYNALQIGQVMLWGGVPQLLLIPFMPKLMKHFNLRWLAMTGFLAMAISALMNVYMSADYAGEQLRLSLIIRAIGQPFMMVPLSVLTTSRLKMEDIGSASGLFNTSRNLSGAIGIAILSTMIDRRTTFHQVRISETLSTFGQTTQYYMDHLQDTLPSLSMQQDMALVMKQVTQNAGIMAFGDCFTIVTGALFFGIAAVLCMRSHQAH